MLHVEAEPPPPPAGGGAEAEQYEAVALPIVEQVVLFPPLGAGGAATLAEQLVAVTLPPDEEQDAPDLSYCELAEQPEAVPAGGLAVVAEHMVGVVAPEPDTEVGAAACIAVVVRTTRPWIRD